MSSRGCSRSRGRWTSTGTRDRPTLKRLNFSRRKSTTTKPKNTSPSAESSIQILKPISKKMGLPIIISALKSASRPCSKKTLSLKTLYWYFTQENLRSNCQRKFNFSWKYCSICMSPASSQKQISTKSKSTFNHRNGGAKNSWSLRRSTKRNRSRKSRRKKQKNRIMTLEIIKELLVYSHRVNRD